MRTILNRDTEAAVFGAQPSISFRLRENQGQVIFGIQAIKQLDLKFNEFVEFEIDGTDWYVMKSVNVNGFRLYKMGGRHTVLGISCNRTVRGFLSKVKVSDGIVKCNLEKEEVRGAKPDYPRWKIVIK